VKFQSFQIMLHDSRLVKTRVKLILNFIRPHHTHTYRAMIIIQGHVLCLGNAPYVTRAKHIIIIIIIIIISHFTSNKHSLGVINHI
jgi:hypothetical protein